MVRVVRGTLPRHTGAACWLNEDTEVGRPTSDFDDALEILAGPLKAARQTRYDARPPDTQGRCGKGKAASGPRNITCEDRVCTVTEFESTLRQQILRALQDACGESSEVETRISDRDLVKLVSRLFKQFVSVEDAAIRVSTEVMGEGQRSRLPGFVAGLRGYTLKLLNTGDSESVATIDEYLGALNCWFAAILEAWEHAPAAWWEEQWETLEPKMLEKAARGGFFRNRFLEYWDAYQKAMRDMRPPDVERAIRSKAHEIARKEMESG